MTCPRKNWTWRQMSEKSQWIICNLSVMQNRKRKPVNVPSFLKKKKAANTLSLLSFFQPHFSVPSLFLTSSSMYSTSAFKKKKKKSFICSTFIKPDLSSLTTNYPLDFMTLRCYIECWMGVILWFDYIISSCRECALGVATGGAYDLDWLL